MEQPPPRVSHRTKIEGVALEDGVLRFEGLFASPATETLRTFALSAPGKTFGPCLSFEHVPRPDVRERFPGHAWLRDPSVTIGGFRVRFALGPEQQQDLRLVALTPRFERGDGHALFCLLKADLPLPGREYTARIGNPDFGFEHVALEFCGFCVQLAGLRPTAAVLDVGCGVGRMAYALAHYLTPDARYDGFDVDEPLIRWCRETITPRFPNFRFRHADLRNGLNNPAGASSAADFAFPHEDAAFDFVLVASVFTHMTAPEVRHYLDEIRRVLKPGGVCLATFFLLNPEAKRLIGAGKSYWNLVHPLREGLAADPKCPEWCVGYEEAEVRRWLADRRFEVAGSYPGNWCGRSLLDSTAHQDMLVLRRGAPGPGPSPVSRFDAAARSG